MNTGNRRGPPTAGPTAETPEDKPLDDVMEEVGDDDTIVITNPFGAPNLVKTKDIIDKTTKKYSEVLLPGGSLTDLPEVAGTSFQLWGYRLGSLPKLTQFRRPDRSKDLLEPAMNAIFKAAPILWREARAVMEGLDLEKAKTTQGRLLLVRNIKAKALRFVSGLDALESNLEVELDGTARETYRRVSSLMTTNDLIGEALADLGKLITQSAQQALETKHVVEKTRAEDAQHPPPPPAPPPTVKPPGPATPGTTPGDPNLPVAGSPPPSVNPPGPAKPAHPSHKKK